MRHIPIYLWKEWREHRAAFGVLLLSLGLVAVMTLTYYGWTIEKATESFFWFPGLCAIGALLTVGSDLFSRDAPTKHAQFVQRVPAGLSPSYWSKLAFFTIVIVGSVLYGIVLCKFAMWLAGGENHTFETQGIFWPAAALAVAVSFWVFANSSWVPTTLIAVPGTLLFGAALLLPIWLIPGRIYAEYHPMRADYWVLLPSTLIGAVVSGRVCYGSLFFRGRTRGIVGLTSFAIAFLSFLPVYLPLGTDFVKWLGRPHRIAGLMRRADSPFAVVQLYRTTFLDGSGTYSQPSAWLLNLQDLTYSELGRGTIEQFARGIGPSATETNSNRVTLWNAQVPEGGGAVRFFCKVYDIRTGQHVEDDPRNGEFSSGGHQAGQQLAERPSSLKTQASGFGSREVLEGRYGVGDTVEFYSPEGPTVEVPYQSFRRTRVLSGDFLCELDERWHVYNKTSKEFEPVDLLRQDEKLCALVDDGSLLTWFENELFLVDLSAGARVPISPVDTQSGSQVGFPGFVGSLNHDRPPLDVHEPLVVSFPPAQSSGSRLGVIDLRARDFRIYPEHRASNHHVIGSNGLHATIIEEGVRLVEIDLETGTRRLLLDTNDL